MYMTSGCENHTDMILVSILTFSRPGVSKMLKSEIFDLETQRQIHFLLTLLISGCMHDY